MKNVASVGLVFYQQDLCKKAKGIVTQSAESLGSFEQFEKAMYTLRGSSTKTFAQFVMGLPKGSDLIDVAPGQSAEQLLSVLSSYAKRFADWALEKPLKPVYMAWKFKNPAARHAHDFNQAVVLGIACCHQDLVNLGCLGGYAGYTKPGTHEWVSYSDVEKSWGEEPWASGKEL